MEATLDWSYQQRNPISFVTAILLTIVFLLIDFSSIEVHQEPDQSMMAYLEPELLPLSRVDQTQVKIPAVQKLEPVKSSPSQAFAQAVLPTELPQEMKSSDVKSYTANPLPISAHSQTPPQVDTPSISQAQANVALENAYAAQLKSYLEKIKKYPSSREARLTHPQGTVGMLLVINRLGELLDVKVLTSSHSNLLDGEALKTIRSGVFPTFPKDAFENESSHQFKVNLEYLLEN
jgi:protein TonB